MARLAMPPPYPRRPLRPPIAGNHAPRLPGRAPAAGSLGCMRLGILLATAVLLTGCDSSESGGRPPMPASREAGSAPLPRPDEPIPRDPDRLARRLAAT